MPAPKSAIHEEAARLGISVSTLYYRRKKAGLKRVVTCSECGYIFEHSHRLTCSRKCTLKRNAKTSLEYYYTNRELVAGKLKAYRQKNLEVIRKRGKKYRKENPELVIARRIAYKIKNHEKIKERAAAARAPLTPEQKAKARKYNLRWRKKNAKIVSEKKHRYELMNKEAIRKRQLDTDHARTAAIRLVNSLVELSVVSLTKDDFDFVPQSVLERRRKRNEYYAKNKKHIRKLTNERNKQYRAIVREKKNAHYRRGAAALKLVRELEKNSIGALLP